MSVKLPRDAEGREIPLETKTLYSKDGKKLCVRKFRFSKITERWVFDLIEADQKGRLCVRIYFTWQVYLEKPAPPDSWEKLLDDLDHAAKGGDNAECLYMRRDGMEVQCPGCRLEDVESDDIECSYLAYADIAARIRKLRGESE